MHNEQSDFLAMGTFPSWLKKSVFENRTNQTIRNILREHGLETICRSSRCPNVSECWSQSRVAFLLLGEVCTRHCSFCAVAHGTPQTIDPHEPQKIAIAVEKLKLRYVVITSVTRDDLPDGGTRQFVACIEQIRTRTPEAKIEILTSDFKHCEEAIRLVAAAQPDIFSHNLETVARLYPSVRPQATYERSLHLLKSIKFTNPSIYTKSGLMVGLGEKTMEVVGAMRDLRDAGCDFLTIGQYLQPSPENLAVHEFVHPDLFRAYKSEAYELGFVYVASGPFVRSSYYAEEALGEVTKDSKRLV